MSHPATWVIVVCASVLLSDGGTGRLFAEDDNTESAEVVAKNQAHGASEADWQAIRTSSEEYMVAFNAGDAKKIANLYAENAELVDANGNKFQGRANIEKEYAAFFQAHPKATMSVYVDELHFVSPTVAMEDGRTETRLGTDSAPVYSQYTAVHNKGAGGWRLASVRDSHLAIEPGAKLEDLKWLIGKWVDEDDDSLLEIDCYWHESGNYLIRDFSVRVEGLLAAHGTERIGWDPVRKQIRSWVFDSEGGFLDAAWTHEEDHWNVTARGFRADGKPSQATYVVTQLREDAYHMVSFQRRAGEETLADLDMTIVRQPPQPALDENAIPASEK